MLSIKGLRANGGRPARRNSSDSNDLRRFSTANDVPKKVRVFS